MDRKEKRKNKNVQLFSNFGKSNTVFKNWWTLVLWIKKEKKCEFCLFIKKFEDLHEEAAQRYLRNQTEEFYECFRKILLQQEDILEKNCDIEEILTKEYQYKNSYQGKYGNPTNVYGPWYLENTTNGFTKHLLVFNLFDEKKIITKE